MRSRRRARGSVAVGSPACVAGRTAGASATPPCTGGSSPHAHRCASVCSARTSAVESAARASPGAL